MMGRTGASTTLRRQSSRRTGPARAATVRCERATHEWCCLCGERDRRRARAGRRRLHRRPRGSTRAAMRLVEADEAKRLYASLTDAVEQSGGGAANTAAIVAKLGGDVTFIGRVADDALGASFTHDIRQVGVTFDPPPADVLPPTAHCTILISPDGERTMNTFLGACGLLSPADLDAEVIAAASVVYVEGFLWDPPSGRDAVLAAIDIAKSAGNAGRPGAQRPVLRRPPPRRVPRRARRAGRHRLRERVRSVRRLRDRRRRGGHAATRRTVPARGDDTAARRDRCSSSRVSASSPRCPGRQGRRYHRRRRRLRRRVPLRAHPRLRSRAVRGARLGVRVRDDPTHRRPSGRRPQHAALTVGGIEAVDPRYVALLARRPRSPRRRRTRIDHIEVHGSIGDGAADQWSDLDVQVYVDPEELDNVLADWPTWLAEITPTVFARTPIAKFIINTITADGLTFDLAVLRRVAAICRVSRFPSRHAVEPPLRRSRQRRRVRRGRDAARHRRPLSSRSWSAASTSAT